MKIAFAIGCLAICQYSLSQIDYKGFREWSWHREDSTEYYLYTPGNIKPDSLYPVALFLHGCCGESYKATLRNTVDPPVRMWHNFGANKQTVPTYIIAPATSRGWKQHIPRLKKIIDDLIAHGQADPKRIYITGFSMGANGTWEFLQQYPDYFAAAMPMGMNFHGSKEKIKNTPIWTLRGQMDYWARDLHQDVWEIRKLNGEETDTLNNEVHGINPRYTSFRNMGHNVQWAAASGDLTGWAYSKINDGNIYPNVHILAPASRQKVAGGSAVKLEVRASDPDGKISKVEIYLNNKLHTTFESEPFEGSFVVTAGDTRIQAIAFDDKGKQTAAASVVHADILPAFETDKISPFMQGGFGEQRLNATGNGRLIFRINTPGSLPAGLWLQKNGTLTGVPEISGRFSTGISVIDEDGDSTSKTFTIAVKKKKKNGVVVSSATASNGTAIPISIVRSGEPIYVDNEDDEVTISEPSVFDGKLLIKGCNKDSSSVNESYISFRLDGDARVYVAYEKHDRLLSSSVPAWLTHWTRAGVPQIVAQYYYYDIYYRDFKKGAVALPGSGRKEARVSNNYFIIVETK